MNNPILQLQNICKSYKQGSVSTEVLKDFSLELNAGEIIAIVGASGSGKSTLLHIAGLLDQADSGAVIIEGQNVTDNDRMRTKLRLASLGFIYQYHHLLKDFTARENVAMPRLIAGKNYEQALADAEQILTALDLENRTYHMPGELSGGQQQRVAIARAMINNPKIILADEPTGNLDHATATNVLKLMMKLVREKNIALVIVTHNPEVSALADRVVTIREIS
jgi:lipoprotein-releasing system ATP-binding protein